jgi:hypothetical protein
MKQIKKISVAFALLLLVTLSLPTFSQNISKTGSGTVTTNSDLPEKDDF